MASDSLECQPDRPPEIEALADEVSVVHDYLHKSASSKKTVSLVVRDMDSREIVAESRLSATPGAYALVSFADPDDPDAYGADVPEPPEWAEWVHSDPPLDHFVNGARCLECGEENRVPRSMPAGQSETAWEWIWHRPGCSHASDSCKRFWGRKRYREYLKARTDPGVMALPCIWDEIERLPDADHLEGPARSGVLDRLDAMYDELCSRLVDRFPACPHCGERACRMGGDYMLECRSCFSREFDNEFYKAFNSQRLRVWGHQGHLGSARDGGGDA